MPHPHYRRIVTDLRDTLGIDAPIVLGPFGGLSSIALTAAVSELGGLGSYGLYGYSPERIRDTIAALRERTAKPFAVNVWLSTGDEVTPAEVDLGPRIADLAPLFEELGLPLPTPPAAFLPDLSAQLDAVLDAAPAVLSVVYGVPSGELVEGARERGIRLIGTATTVAEAVALDEAGVDAIVATGAEAAGHRVSFLAPAEESLVGTFALVPQVVDAVRRPVIAAGGVADRRGVAAALALGASGVQVGTAFLRTQESAAPPSHRKAIAEATDTTTVLTRAMSGRLARGIPNRAMRMLGEAEVLPFPAQNWISGQFRAEAGRRDIGDLVSLWAGQSAPLARRQTAAEVFAELLAGLPD
ncbi:nitronate monooxygenase [Microbacterium sp.]|uniref:NAD(P)H-dependent flavin oxidoreductase n=1 Tax=Microbacterium sp. TaxID=51671 RepID=UPI002BFB6557|nr:nitronate monooxygenase [Microbacterium sp.]HWL77895.1 nitronate monooxygenase [Microbacterium sp.]